MRHVSIPPLDEPLSYTVTTAQTEFDITFPFFATTDVLFYVDGELIDAADYTITPLFVQEIDGELEDVDGAFGSGTLTLDTAVENCAVTIDRFVPPDRESDFSSSAPLSHRSVNTAFDKLAANSQDLLRRFVTGSAGIETALAAAEADADRAEGAASGIQQFGYTSSVALMDGEGTVDNRALLASAWTAAVALDNTLEVAPGEFAVTAQSGENVDVLEPPAGVTSRGRGRGKTRLRFDVADTGFKNLIKQTNDDFELADMDVEVTSVAGANAILLSQRADRLICRNVGFYGDLTGSTPQANIYLHKHVAESEYTLFDGCHFERLLFAGTKNNDATFATRSVIFRNITSKDFYGYIGNNSPSGPFHNGEISGFFCDGNPHQPFGEYGLLGFAGGSLIRIVNGALTGEAGWGVHIEENVTNCVVADIVSDFHGGNFVEVLENDVAGSYSRPERVVLANLVHCPAEGTRQNGGIVLVLNASPTEMPVTAISIVGCIMANVQYGFLLGVKGENAVAVAACQARDCAYGVYLPFSRVTNLGGMVISASAVGVHAVEGGIVSNFSIHDTPILGETENLKPLVASDFEANYNDQTYAATTTTWVRIARNVRRVRDRAMIVRAGVAGTGNWTVEIADVDFDGSGAATVSSENVLDNSQLNASVDVVKAAASATIGAGGSGHAVNDILTVANTNPTGGSDPTFRVLTVSGGAVTSVEVVNRGETTQAGATANPAATTSSGAGTGCTLNVTYENDLVAGIANSGAQLTGTLSIRVPGTVTI